MNKPLLFATPGEAVTYLELMGFTVEAGEISWHGLTPCTHRILYAIDWLCDEWDYAYLGKQAPYTAGEAA